MSEKHIEQGSGLSKKERDAFFKKFNKDSSNLELLNDLFENTPEELTKFLSLKVSSPTAAAGLFFKKLAEHNKDDKKKIAEIRESVVTLKKIAEEEVTTKAKKVEEKVAAPVVESVETPVVAEVTKEVAPVQETKEEETKETIAESSEPVVEIQTEEKKKAQKEETSDLVRRLNILKLINNGTGTREELSKLSDKELQKRVQVIYKKEDHAIFAQKYNTAYRFLRGKISQQEIKKIPTSTALVAKALEVASKSLNLQSIEEIETYNKQKSDTARVLDRELDDKKIAQINNLLGDENVPIITHKKPDLDSKVSLFFLQAVGEAKSKEIRYVEKGASKENGILIDVGGSNSIVSVGENRWESDHHFQDKWIKTSSAETVLETLRRAGKAEKIESWMEGFASFVTEIDNMSYPRKDKEWFANVYPKTILGLRDMLSTESLAGFFKSGKDPYEPLTDEELTLTCTDAKGESKSLVDLVMVINERVQKSIENVELYEKRAAVGGHKNISNEFGKVLFYETSGRATSGKGKDIPLGTHAAYNMGYDAYVRYDEAEKFYFVSYPGRDLKEFFKRIKHRDPNAKLIRGTMIHSQKAKTDPLAGPGLADYQLENYLGLTIPKDLEKVATNVEYETRRIVQAQQRSLKLYKNQISGAQEIFTDNIAACKENIARLEAVLESGKNRPEEKRLAQEKFITARIEALRKEITLWEDKIKTAESLRGKPRSLFRTLVDETKIVKGSSRAEAAATAGEAAVIETIELTQEDITAQLEEVTAEYAAVAEKLKTTSGTLEETRSLMLEHYNLWQLGLFLQNGAAGEKPVDLTWEQLKPILIADKANKAAAPKSAPEATFSHEPAAVETPVEETQEYANAFGARFSEGVVGKAKFVLGGYEVNEGDYVEAGETICSVESDKVDHEFQAKQSGFVHFVIQEGDEFTSGDIIAYITPGEKPVEEPSGPSGGEMLPNFKKEKMAPTDHFATEEHEEDGEDEEEPTQQTSRDKFGPARTHERKDPETVPVSKQQMIDFIGNTIVATFTEQNSENFESTNLNIKRASGEDAADFNYVIKQKGIGDVELKGRIYFPDTAEPFIVIISEAKSKPHGGMINQIAGSINNWWNKKEHQTLAHVESVQLNNALNRAMKEQFGDKIPVIES